MKKQPSPDTQSSADRRAAEAQIRELISRHAAAHLRLVAATRRWLGRRLPTAHEMVYEYRDNFAISYSPSGNGYEGVFALRAAADGVRLYFNQAKGLPDPEKLLQGSGGLVRWIPVEAAATLARPDVLRLVDEALARNPVPFAARGRGPVVVRETAAGKRRRK